MATRVILLAGGFGTRVSHLLRGTPKPMAPVCGKPFLEWVVRFYARHGLTDFILSTGYLAEAIDSHFAGQPVPGTRVVCRREDSPLGTAGGALHCLPPDATPECEWLVANGDSLVMADPAPLLERLRSGFSPAAILGRALPDAGRYGSLEIDSSGRLVSFREKRPGPATINAGVYAFKGSVLLAQSSRRPLSFELDVLPTLAAAGQVAAVTTSAPFIDIGTPETLAEAERFVTENRTHFLP